MGTLSIRENLHFSAALRLPSKMTHKERKDRVDKVVQELGLEKVENSKVKIIKLDYRISSKNSAQIIKLIIFTLCQIFRDKY